MRRAAVIWILGIGLAAVAAVGARAALSDETGSGVAADADIAQIKKDINTLLLNQQTILTELKNVREELDVVKIRCSS